MSYIKVSVCISVYNGAKYIERCLDYVYNQTLKELEIVVVNDGSTDNSLALINKYVQNHPDRRFVIVSQENGGLCRGRRAGVKNTTGEYITFFDQDDYIDPSTYEKMSKCIEQNDVDIVEMSTRYGDKVISSPYKGVKDSHDVLRRYFRKGGIRTMLWLRLYKRSLFEKDVLPDIYTNNEDMFAFPCILHVAKKIYFLDEPLHIYSIDNDSSYMNTLKLNSYNSKKPYDSFKIRLLSLNHFTAFVGSDNMQEYQDDYNHYKARYIYAFLMSNFYKVSMDEKVSYTIEQFALTSYNELRSFLLTWLAVLPSVIYRFFGLRATYYVYYIIHLLKKRGLF